MTPVRGMRNRGGDAEYVWMVSFLKSLRSLSVRLLGPPAHESREQESGSLGLAQFSALTRP